MKNNKKRTIFLSILFTYIIIIIGVFSYFYYLKDYIKISECPFFKYLGIYCPACYGTRAVQSLLKFDIFHSLLYNPIVCYIFVFASLFLILEAINYIFKKDIRLPYTKIVYIGIIILIINCIIKNILLFI